MTTKIDPKINRSSADSGQDCSYDISENKPEMSCEPTLSDAFAYLSNPQSLIDTSLENRLVEMAVSKFGPSVKEYLYGEEENEYDIYGAIYKLSNQYGKIKDPAIRHELAQKISVLAKTVGDEVKFWEYRSLAQQDALALPFGEIIEAPMIEADTQAIEGNFKEANKIYKNISANVDRMSRMNRSLVNEMVTIISHHQAALSAGIASTVAEFRAASSSAEKISLSKTSFGFVQDLYRLIPTEQNLQLVFQVGEETGWGIYTLFSNYEGMTLQTMRERLAENNRLISEAMAKDNAPHATLFKEMPDPVATESKSELSAIVEKNFREFSAQQAMLENKELTPLVEGLEKQILKLVRDANNGNEIAGHVQTSMAYMLMGDMVSTKTYLLLARDAYSRKTSLGPVTTQDLIDHVTVLHRLASLSTKGYESLIYYLDDAWDAISSIQMKDRKTAAILRIENAELRSEINSDVLRKKLSDGIITELDYEYDVREGYKEIIFNVSEALADIEDEAERKELLGKGLTAKAAIIEHDLDVSYSRYLNEQDETEDGVKSYNELLEMAEKGIADLEKYKEKANELQFNEAMARAKLALTYYKFRRGEVALTIESLQSIVKEYPLTSAAKVIKTGWPKSYGIINDNGEFSSEINEPSFSAALKTAAGELTEKPGRSLKACAAGATAAVALDIFVFKGRGGGLSKHAIQACTAAYLAERALYLAENSGKISEAYRTGISSVSTEEAAKSGGLFALNLFSMYIGGALGGLAERATLSLGTYAGRRLTTTLIGRLGVTPGPWLRAAGSFALREAVVVPNAYVFHKTSGAITGSLLGTHEDNEQLGVLESWFFVRMMKFMHVVNPGNAIAKGNIISERALRSGINTVGAAASIEFGHSLAQNRGFSWDNTAATSIELMVMHQGNKALERILPMSTVEAIGRRLEDRTIKDILLTKAEIDKAKGNNGDSNGPTAPASLDPNMSVKDVAETLLGGAGLPLMASFLTLGNPSENGGKNHGKNIDEAIKILSSGEASDKDFEHSVDYIYAAKQKRKGRGSLNKDMRTRIVDVLHEWIGILSSDKIDSDKSGEVLAKLEKTGLGKKITEDNVFYKLIVTLGNFLLRTDITAEQRTQSLNLLFNFGVTDYKLGKKAISVIFDYAKQRPYLVDLEFTLKLTDSLKANIKNEEMSAAIINILQHIDHTNSNGLPLETLSRLIDIAAKFRTTNPSSQTPKLINQILANHDDFLKVSESYNNYSDPNFTSTPNSIKKLQVSLPLAHRFLKQSILDLFNTNLINRLILKELGDNDPVIAETAAQIIADLMMQNPHIVDISHLSIMRNGLLHKSKSVRKSVIGILGELANREPLYARQILVQLVLSGIYDSDLEIQKTAANIIADILSKPDLFKIHANLPQADYLVKMVREDIEKAPNSREVSKAFEAGLRKGMYPEKPFKIKNPFASDAAKEPNGTKVDNDKVGEVVHDSESAISNTATPTSTKSLFKDNFFNSPAKEKTFRMIMASLVGQEAAESATLEQLVNIANGKPETFRDAAKRRLIQLINTFFNRRAVVDTYYKLNKDNDAPTWLTRIRNKFSNERVKSDIKTLLKISKELDGVKTSCVELWNFLIETNLPIETIWSGLSKVSRKILTEDMGGMRPNIVDPIPTALSIAGSSKENFSEFMGVETAELMQTVGEIGKEWDNLHVENIEYFAWPLMAQETKGLPKGLITVSINDENVSLHYPLIVKNGNIYVGELNTLAKSDYKDVDLSKEPHIGEHVFVPFETWLNSFKKKSLPMLSRGRELRHIRFILSGPTSESKRISSLHGNYRTIFNELLSSPETIITKAGFDATELSSVERKQMAAAIDHWGLNGRLITKPLLIKILNFFGWSEAQLNKIKSVNAKSEDSGSKINDASAKMIGRKDTGAGFPSWANNLPDGLKTAIHGVLSINDRDSHLKLIAEARQFIKQRHGLDTTYHMIDGSKDSKIAFEIAFVPPKLPEDKRAKMQIMRNATWLFKYVSAFSNTTPEIKVTIRTDKVLMDQAFAHDLSMSIEWEALVSEKATFGAGHEATHQTFSRAVFRDRNHVRLNDIEEQISPGKWILFKMPDGQDRSFRIIAIDSTEKGNAVTLQDIRTQQLFQMPMRDCIIARLKMLMELKPEWGDYFIHNENGENRLLRLRDSSNKSQVKQYEDVSSWETGNLRPSDNINLTPHIKGFTEVNRRSKPIRLRFIPADNSPNKIDDYPTYVSDEVNAYFRDDVKYFKESNKYFKIVNDETSSSESKLDAALRLIEIGVVIHYLKDNNPTEEFISKSLNMIDLAINELRNGTAEIDIVYGKKAELGNRVIKLSDGNEILFFDFQMLVRHPDQTADPSLDTELVLKELKASKDHILKIHAKLNKYRDNIIDKIDRGFEDFPKIFELANLIYKNNRKKQKASATSDN